VVRQNTNKVNCKLISTIICATRSSRNHNIMYMVVWCLCSTDLYVMSFQKPERKPPASREPAISRKQVNFLFFVSLQLSQTCMWRR